MTIEEAIREIKNMAKFNYTLAPMEVFDMAIKALEQEPCEDAISRQAVLDIAKSSKSNWIDNSVLFKRVNELPSVTSQPKTGHWILADEQNKEDVENDNYRFICSECQCSDIHAKGTKVPYCWSCGAKMESEE